MSLEPSKDPTAVNPTQWGVRKRLPSRRSATTQALKIGPQKLFLTVGHFSDGNPAEIFIKLDREGSTLAVMTDSWCIAFSFALQWGVPLERLINKYRWTRCEPDGVVEGHPDVVRATSIQDLVAQVLAVEYLGKEVRWATPPVPSLSPEPVLISPDSETVVDDPQSELVKHIAQAREQGYSGNCCIYCGSFRLKRSGTCEVCEVCGSTSGCS